jgi:uracil-DNA glycosylase family 4
MEALDRLHNSIRRCRRCRLWKGRRRAVPGEGPCPAKMMFIGQAPGRNEDRTGRPFVGMAGRFLDSLFKHAKIDRKKVFITSAVKCLPPANRPPKKDEIRACRYYLTEQIRLVKPKVVVLLGKTACNAVLGGINLGKAHGKRIEKDKITYIPTYHPAAGMCFPRIRKMMERDFHGINKMSR